MKIEISDLVGFAKPMTKLLDVISKGLGTIYRPRAIRQEAMARAEEIKLLAAAAAEVEAIKAKSSVLSEIACNELLEKADVDIMERARLRLVSREIESQRNLEAIAEFALTNLPETVSENPVDDDWRRHFFGTAENISDESMQLLWGKVLAGEVSNPGSFSIRTLNVLRGISKTEAEKFRLACRLAFGGGFIVELEGNFTKMHSQFGLIYNDLLALRDAGLLHENDKLQRPFTEEEDVLVNNGIILRLSSKNLQNIPLQIISFSSAGRELQKLIEPDPLIPYLNILVAHLRSNGIFVERWTDSEIIDGVSVDSYTYFTELTDLY